MPSIEGRGPEQSLEISRPSEGISRPRPSRRLSNLPEQGLDDRFSIHIPMKTDAHHTAVDTWGFDHWKVKVLEFIHSNQVQYFLMFLLFADVIILFIELFLIAYYPPCHIVERDAISCCDDGTYNATADAHHGGEEEEHHLMRFLSAEREGTGEHAHCDAPAVESDFMATCDPHKWDKVHTAEQIFFWMTIVILSVFMLELLAEIIILRKKFFKQFFYVLDFFIVSTSLGLEIAFAVIKKEYLIQLSAVLIFGRVWRFVRVGHGIIELTHGMATKDKVVLMEYAASLEKKLQENDIALPEKNKELLSIEKELTHHSHGTDESHDKKKEQNNKPYELSNLSSLSTITEARPSERPQNLLQASWRESDKA